MSDTDINATVNVTEDIYPDVDSTAVSAAVIDDGDSIVVPAEVDFGDTLDAELEDENLIDVPVDESVGIQGDHRVLLHRDAANQHPMSAITGLGDALDAINTELSSRIGQVEAESAELEVDMASALLRIGDLQDQVDGNITTWFYAAEPSMNLPPVTLDPSNPQDTGWDTPEKKNAHKGDLYYNTLTGYAYRFAYADGDYGWMRITDTDVVKALADAARAQDTADSKRRVFYSTPYPPYDKGDLWVQGSSGDILVCTTSKPADGSYSVSDWSAASKYTDDYVANMALASANGKNTVYHQPSQPTGGTYKKGDTWFDTDDDYTMYTYDGALWIKEQFGNEAIADLSITNAKIANATIEYGKIKSVDAGKITTGTLDAARIGTGSITIGKINTDTQAKILNSNIEVGGRNQAKLSYIWSRTAATITTNGITFTNLGEGRFSASGTATNTGDIWWTNSDSSQYPFGKDGTHTYSIYLESGTFPSNIALQVAEADNTPTWKRNVVGDAGKTTMTFTTPSGNHPYHIGFTAKVAGASINMTFKVKMESGNKATDWTPAPEDVQAEIDAKKSVHTLMAPGGESQSSATYAQILAWCTEGRTESWNVAPSTDGIKIGDTVRVGYYVSNMGSAGSRPVVYCVGTVTAIVSSVRLTMTMHGLDTTIIDGGNILTNSIGANQIATGAITIGNLSDDAQNGIVYKVGTSGETGTYPYLKLCTIKTLGAYKNKDVTFQVSSRASRMDTMINWAFTNASSATTSAVSHAYRTGGTPFFYASEGNGAYGIYLTKAERYENIQVHSLYNPFPPNAAGTDGIQITWVGTEVTALPSGYGTFTVMAGGRFSSDIDNAAKTATTYITHIDNNGIRIHPSSTQNNSVVINASGMEIFKGGTGTANSVAKYGSDIRLGKETSSRLFVTSEGIGAYTPNGVQLFSLNKNGGLKNQYARLKEWQTHAQSENLSTTLGSAWTNLPAGQIFRIRGTCYYETASDVGVAYARPFEQFTKGTASTGTVITYDGNNTLTISTSGIPSGGTYEYSDLEFLKVDIVPAPFYSFADGAPTAGGANSFVVGTGTVAGNPNQLALGAYNAERLNGLLIIGGGTSSARKNLAVVTDTGDLYLKGNLYVSSNDAGTSGTKANSGIDIASKITFGSAWTQQVRVARRIGNMVFFQLEANAGSFNANTNYVLANIASGYRPAVQQFATGITTDGSYNPKGTVSAVLKTDGSINVRTQAASSSGAFVFVSGFYYTA